MTVSPDLLSFSNTNTQGITKTWRASYSFDHNHPETRCEECDLSTRFGTYDADRLRLCPCKGIVLPPCSKETRPDKKDIIWKLFSKQDPATPGITSII